MASLDFLAEGNICGQTLLRLVARGSAIVAELLRLSDHVPAALADAAGGDGAAAPASRYAPILFDFRYLKTPEMFDKQINTSIALGELDEEFYSTHEVRRGARAARPPREPSGGRLQPRRSPLRPLTRTARHPRRPRHPLPPFLVTRRAGGPHPLLPPV
jgi:hypothetical protein